MILKEKKVIVLSSAIFLAGVSLFPSFSFLTIQTASGADDVSDTESSIEKTEKQLREEQEKKARYESDVQRLQGAVNSTQSVINQAANVIETAEETIARKEGEIKKIEDTIEKQKEILTRLIQEAYYNYNRPLFYVTINNDNITETFAMRDHLSGLKKKVVVMMDEIKQSQQELENEKGELQEKKQEHEEILEEKQDEKNILVNEKEVFEQKVAAKAATISEIQQKLSELKNDLNKILGKSYDTGDVKDAIKFANKQTGVSKGFLFGMLSIESRLGASVGGCDYKESRMSDYRKTLFKDICEELDYNYKKMKVSCPPASYSGTGGAMGAAQFMSDTWTGYKSQIAATTGHNPPDPWNLVDGVMAMALKLRNDEATAKDDIRITSPCSGKKIYVDPEIYASMKYLGWSCYALENYGPRIQSLKDGYDNL